MGERIGLLVALAFLATRFRVFRSLFAGQASWRERIQLGLIFGLFGIIGTYTGVIVTTRGVTWGELVGGPLHSADAIANSRAVSVVVAGLVGGPVTGLTAGLLAGTHRLLIGGFTGLACAVATTSQGLLSGLLRRHLTQRNTTGLPAEVGLLVGVLMELLQMAIILLIARPYTAALGLVKLIALPMIVANSLGVAFFLALTRSILTSEAALEGDAARKALSIATRTLPFLSKGLTMETAQAAAEVIRSLTALSAVALTDTQQILAHVGVGDDHHRPGVPLRTRVTTQAIDDDRILVAEDAQEIQCDRAGCPLHGVVVVPLHESDQVVGTLKLYYDPARTRAPLELADGLGYHFSTQLSLARVQEQGELLKKAEIRALQAQIQPHFLFNALNTVMALIRIDPEQARAVLGHLGDYLRRNLQSTQVETVPLAQELEHVRHYLAVEQARYGPRLQVTHQIDPRALSIPIPPLTLQPLVENAIAHGLKAVRGPWQIHLTARVDGGHATVSVQDNGQGIAPDRLTGLLERPAPSSGQRSGLALYNVHRRLRGLFGPEAGLTIDSDPGSGTTVTFRLPVPPPSEEKRDDDSSSGGG